MSSAKTTAMCESEQVSGERGRTVIMHETVAATMTNACELAARVTNEVRDLLTDDQAGLLDLGLTEAMTNIVRHGYADKADDANTISVTVHRQDSLLAIDVVDRGTCIPADVLAQDEDAAFNFDPEDLESIPEGGMGIGLIKKSFDALEYTVHAGVNTMHLETRLINGTGAP